MTELEALHWVLQNKLHIIHYQETVLIYADGDNAIGGGPTFLDAVIMAKGVMDKRAA